MTNENTINNKEILKEEQLDSVAGGILFNGEMNPPFKEIFIRPTNDEPKKNIRYDDAVRG